MGEYFYAKEAVRNLGELRRLRKELWDSFADFDTAVFSEGALTVKYKELLAVACAHVTRCPYCIEAHSARARQAGASDEEIAEAIFVAAAMSAGASVAHSCIAMGSPAGRG